MSIKRLALKPNVVAWLTVPACSDLPGYSHACEILSYPIPGVAGATETIMVRRVPAHPGTLIEVAVPQLGVLPWDTRQLSVHYARAVPTRGSIADNGFPIDMLRYDSASMLNFGLADGFAMIDPKFGLVDELWIATTRPATHRNVWTSGRWESFGWHLVPKRSERYGGGQS